MKNEVKHTAHSSYRCEYHIIFAPKYRRRESHGGDIGRYRRNFPKTVQRKERGNHRSRSLSESYPLVPGILCGYGREECEYYKRVHGIRLRVIRISRKKSGCFSGGLILRCNAKLSIPPSRGSR